MKYYTVVFAVSDEDAKNFRELDLEAFIERERTALGGNPNPIQGAHVFGPYSSRHYAMYNLPR